MSTPQSSASTTRDPAPVSGSASSSTPTRGGSSSSSTAKSSSQTVVHGEDRLPRTWRTLASCFISLTQKMDKVHKLTAVAADATKDPKQQQLAMRELDEYVVLFLRTRVEWGRLLSYFEAKLEGRQQELETIQQYYRTMPTLDCGLALTTDPPNTSGGDLELDRKRKRDSSSTTQEEVDMEEPANKK